MLSEGVSVEEIRNSPLFAKFCEHMVTMKEGFVRFMPYNQIMPRWYLNLEKRVKEFPARPDDVWVASFPKCGEYNDFALSMTESAQIKALFGSTDSTIPNI